ncbi:MAG: MFS transporter [Leifsonia xyli]|nr:MAG: MFS transporter [Leifsonia xyli]
MIEVLRNRNYATLFSAQVIALVGTGLLTVALGLLAFDIAGGDAGVVLGTALTIKMVAYVVVSPLMAAVAARVPRKLLLVSSDVIRGGVALMLPFVTDTWQIYLLIFVLQAASATFTPAFQAVIPQVLPDERQFTSALSLSRLAYDLESLLSPMLAAALLTVLPYNDLFLGTVVGFAGSAVLVLLTRFPHSSASAPPPFFERLTGGLRVFLRTPPLRGLLALNVVVAAGQAMIIVNTVVLVQAGLGRSQSDVAWLLAASGVGSLTVAVLVPRLLERWTDRALMLTGAVAVVVALLLTSGVIALAAQPFAWPALFVVWAIAGAAASLILTPSARLLRRASDDTNRPAVFAAQFSLSHVCFMITYPIAGVLGAALGLWSVALVLAVIGAGGAAAAVVGWKKTAVAD